MSTFRRDLTLVGTMDDLPRIGEFVEIACDAAEVAPDSRFDLLMAVDEACCNIFEHAYGRESGQLSISFETRNDDVIITMRDHGHAFDPEGVPAPDTNSPLEQRPVGGLGLHLMRKLMDQVSFEFSPAEGNTLVMEKHGALSAGARPKPRSKARKPHQ